MNAPRKRSIALTQVAPGCSIEEARGELNALQRAELRARHRARRQGLLFAFVAGAALWFAIIAACTFIVRAHAGVL